MGRDSVDEMVPKAQPADPPAGGTDRAVPATGRVRPPVAEQTADAAARQAPAAGRPSGSPSAPARAGDSPAGDSSPAATPPAGSPAAQDGHDGGAGRLTPAAGRDATPHSPAGAGGGHTPAALAARGANPRGWVPPPPAREHGHSLDSTARRAQERQDRAGDSRLMGTYDKVVDGADAVSKTLISAKTSGGSGEGAADAGGASPSVGKGIGGGIAGKGAAKVVGTADSLVHSTIDKTVEFDDRTARPAPRTRAGRALREDGKAIKKGALGGAYEGLKAGGTAGAMWEGGRGAIVAALRSNTAHVLVGTATKVFVATSAATFVAITAFLMVLIMGINMLVATAQSTWVYKAGEAAAGGKELFIDKPVAVAVEGVNRAQQAADATANAVEWTVGFAVDKASGVIEEVTTGVGGGNSEPADDPTSEPTGEATDGPGVAAPASARPAKTVHEEDGVYWVDGQQIAVSTRYGVPLGGDLPQSVWLLSYETPEPAPQPGRTIEPTTGPTGEPTSEPAPTEDPEADEDGETSTDSPADDAEVKNYEIDEEKARELGLTEAEYTDPEFMSRFVATHVGTRVAELGREEGMYPNLSNGVVLDTKGIGFVSDSGADRNQAVRDIYAEAISELPIVGIEDKAEQIVQEAARLWMGQTCEAPGAGGGGSDGTFTGEGVPEHAIPWIERAAGTSKYSIPAAFFAFIIDQETDFREDTGHVPDSNGGTRGIFQMNQMLWKKYYGHPWGADLNNNGKPDENEGLIAAEVGAKYFDDRLETVRGIRERNSGKPLATELTDLEALLIAHNAGESRLLSYPRIPAITKQYLANYREAFEKYGGGSPSDTPDGGGSDSDSSSGDGGSDSGGGSSSSRLVKPQGEWPKTSDRGVRVHPVTGATRFHAGTDYGMPSGTSLPAMFDGTVSFSGWMGGYGNIVIVKGSWEGQTLGYAYAHMTASKVKVGQQVKAGDLIGISGNTGVGTGPHLHLELRTDGWTQGGREHNTADAHAFLESNGGEIVGSPTTPDGGGGDGGEQACGGGTNDSPTGVPDGIPAEKCDGNAGKVEEGLAPNGVNVLRAICGSFPEVQNWSGRRYSSIIGNKSDHYTGHAVDAMVNHSGSNDSELGDRISEYLIENADSLNIRYIIWEQRIWYPGRDWKKMGDRGNETQNHMDHVHVSVNP